MARSAEAGVIIRVKVRLIAMNSSELGWYA
jgi:hypothetical protein